MKKDRNTPFSQRQQKINLPAGQLLIGRNSLREVLKHSPERLIKVLISKADSQQLDDLVAQISPQIISRVDRFALDELAGSDSHQGVLAVLKPRANVDVKSWMQQLDNQETSLLLLLDGVQDPHNLGAILRAAECFGVDAVIWSKNRGPTITPAVTKVSAGASELVQTIEVSNLVDIVGKLKDRNFWVVALENDASAKDLQAFEFPKKCALVMGSEGAGVSHLLKKQADFLLKIPLHGQINSLNVSQATTVVLYEFRRQVAGYSHVLP